MEYTDALLIGAILGVVELLKLLDIPRKIIPIASLILGLAAGIFYVFPDDLQAGILTGIILGLSASGLYSGTKTVIKTEE